MNSAVSDLLCEVTVSKNTKFEVVWTRPSGSIRETWKSRSNLSVSGIHI